MPSTENAVRLSSSGGRLLAGTVAAICVASEIAYFTSGQSTRGLLLAPAFAFVIVAVWMLFWSPAIVIDEVINPLRVYRIGWSEIRGTESRWVLTLLTSRWRVAVWAAPRARRGVTGIDVRRDSYGRPDYEAEQQFERQSTPTGVASIAEQVIVDRLERFGEGDAPTGTGDPNAGDGGSVMRRWRIPSIVVLAVLLVVVIVVSVFR